MDTLDAVIIGAGFGGLYQLHLLRQAGLKARIYDRGGDVGGTWWYNNYPGARVDFPGGPFYCYTFSEELAQEWDWPEKQPAQPDVLNYLRYVADKFDLRRDIQLQTEVTGARFDEAASRWVIETDGGQTVTARFLVCATGSLSAAFRPDIPGLDDFAGQMYHTGRWPKEPVTFAGKRVGVIGTGSSGIQAIPIIARQAEQLTVFQRSPQYATPTGNGLLDEALVRDVRANWQQIRQRMIESPTGAPTELPTRSALEDTPEQRNAVYEAWWQRGGLGIAFSSYTDILTNAEANETLAEFIRGKIRQIVKDPETARKLLPDYFYATKRPVLGDGYYEAFNRDNVALVDLREDPIERVTAQGVRTASALHELDMLVLATGYDALTGALTGINPVGRGGRSLREQWGERFDTYLGITIPGFPNLFMIHGPQSPSVLFNMPLGAELQAEWIRDCIRHLDERGLTVIEASEGAAQSWDAEVNRYASQTLFPRTNSWYTGANIPGKHRQFVVHLGGPEYFRQLTAVAANDYEGLVATGS